MKVRIEKDLLYLATLSDNERETECEVPDEVGARWKRVQEEFFAAETEMRAALEAADA